MREDADRGLEALADAVLDGAFTLPGGIDVSAADDLPASLIEQFSCLARIGAAFRSQGDSSNAGERVPCGPPVYWNGFQLLECAGSGTFGEVYRAVDPGLDRIIALKLQRTEPVPCGPGLATTALPAPAQTLAEAKLLARVRHSNVVTIHGAAFVDGRVGLWMEFVDGRTLHQQTTTDGTQAAAELLRTVRALADAVNAVHASGLIHGDISAKNVMVECSGRLVLMDFGAGREQWRSPWRGGVVGTPVYMAPELFDGQPPTPASDLFSLGVLAYFAAVGTYPYAGPDLTASARRYRGVSIKRLRPDLPPDLSAVIDRLLARDPAVRHSSAADVVAALEKARAVPARKRHAHTPLAATALVLLALSSYAVSFTSKKVTGKAAADVAPSAFVGIVPFRGASPDDLTLVSSDLTDRVARAFQGSPIRVVRALESQFTLDGRLKPELATAVQLDVVLRATLVVSAGKWRLNLEGRDPRTGRQVWMRPLVVRAGDIQALEARMVTTIEESVGRVTKREALPPGRMLSEGEQERMRGVLQLKLRKGETLERARQHFVRALELDPTLTDAHAGLASAYALLGQFRLLPRGDANRRARASAVSALALDETNAEAYSALGYVSADEGNLPEAEAHFLRAMTLDPFNANAPHWYALTLAHSGRAPEAVPLIERARELDPLSPSIASDVGVVYLAAGNRAGALAEFDRAIALDPSSAEPHLRVAEVLELQGHLDRALHRYREALRLSPGNPTVRGSIAFLDAKLGNMKAARQEREALERLAQNGFVSADVVAEVCFALGDIGGALRWVARRLDAEGSNPQHVWGNVRLAPLQRDPRFKALVDQAAARGKQAPWGPTPPSASSLP